MTQRTAAISESGEMTTAAQELLLCPVARTAEDRQWEVDAAHHPRPHHRDEAFQRAGAFPGGHQPEDALRAADRVRARGRPPAPHVRRGAAEGGVFADTEGTGALRGDRGDALVWPHLARRWPLLSETEPLQCRFLYGEAAFSTAGFESLVWITRGSDVGHGSVGERRPRCIECHARRARFAFDAATLRSAATVMEGEIARLEPVTMGE